MTNHGLKALVVAACASIAISAAGEARAAAWKHSAPACAAGQVDVRGQGISCRVHPGLWKVALRHGAFVLSHGPDGAPADVTPASLAATPRQPVCAASNPSGDYGLVAVVATPPDVTPSETDASFRGRIAGANGALYDAAVESGSAAGADFVFRCDSVGQVRVDHVTLATPSAQATFSTIVGDLQAKGYAKANEKYVVWYEGRIPSYCGQGSFYRDERASSDNRNDSGPDYAVSYSCDSILHETAHTLGAVQYNAPFSTGSGLHCWEEYDVMCYADGGNEYPGSLQFDCNDKEHFDCLHNDYFDAKIGAGQGGGTGSYLDTHWNLGGCYVRFIVNYSCPRGGAGPSQPSSPPAEGSYAASVLSHNPAAYWRLGEGSGTSALDLSGNANTGSYTGGVTLGQPGALAGDPDPAAAFNGSSAYVNVPASPSLALTGDLTLEAWVKPTDYGNFNGIVGKTTANLPAPFDFYLTQGGGLPRLYRGGPAGIGQVTATSAPPIGRWSLVAVVVQGTSVTHYLNGVPNGTGTIAAAAADGGGPLRIGNRADGFTAFKGALDEVAVYGHALSAAELRADYTAGAPALAYRSSVLSHNPAAYWRLGEGSGTSALDLSGNANTGSYTGGVTLGQPGALAGDPDPAAAFNGSSAYVNVPASPSLALTGDLTLEAWVKPTDYGNFNGIVGKTTANLPAPFDFYLTQGGGLPRLYRGGPAGIGQVTATSAPPIGRWSLVAVVVQGTSVTHYLNGVPNGTGTIAAAAADGGGPLRIGNRADGFTAFKGALDEVAVYGHALSAAELRADYTAGAPTPVGVAERLPPAHRAAPHGTR